MKRRWIIRGIFIALLALSVGGWIVSTWYLYGTGVTFDTRRANVYAQGGVINFHITRILNKPGMGRFGFFGKGFNTFVVRQPHAQFWPKVLSKGDYWFIGFGYKYTRTMGISGDDRIFSVPYWLLTLLSAAGLWFVWRKTRPNLDPRTAFPVEVNQT